MQNYFTRNETERNTIKLAYNFELDSIEKNSSEPNPWRQVIINNFKDGTEVWNAIEDAVELYYENRD